MRLLTIFFLFFTSLNVFGQYINGPANVRVGVNGKILFSLNDYVRIHIVNDSITDDWHKIMFYCKVNPEDLINRTTIRANTTLYSIEGDSVGHTVNESEILNRRKDHKNYDELEMIRIFMRGYTYKTNIRRDLAKEEILSNKTSFSDISSGSFIRYLDENGLTVTKIEQSNYSTPYVVLDGKPQEVVVKETQIIKRTSGIEGQECTIDLEITSDCLSENPKSSFFSVEADKVIIRKETIEAIKSGCCSAPNSNQLFKIESFKKLMDYDDDLFKVDIPNSDLKGFIGFDLAAYDENKRHVGTLTFCSLDSTINRVKLVTNNKSKYDAIAKLSPALLLEKLNEKDQLNEKAGELRLWSKNKSLAQRDLSNFNLQIQFYGDDARFNLYHKIEFRNGFINGNPKKEFEIIID